MKRFILVLASLIISFSAAFAQTEVNNYKFGKITDIDASFIYELHITKGSSSNVKVEYPKSFKDFVSVKYEYGKLILKNRLNKGINTKNNEKIIVTLQMETVKSLDLSGVAKADFNGNFNTNNLDIELSGCGAVYGLVINGRKATLDCSGASHTELTGKFDSMELDLSGASKIKYTGDVTELHGDISGASNFSYNGDCHTSNIEVSGAANVSFSGEGKFLGIDCSGASKFSGRNFVSQIASVELSGASKATINAESEITTQVSTSSYLTYYGSAKIIDKSQRKNIRRGN